MKTLKELYRIGHGPSSSHTMGPRLAAQRFQTEHPEAVRFNVTLYGSLAATGKGHLTDVAIYEILGKECTSIDWQPDVFLPFHPNGMNFQSINLSGDITGDWTVYSVGGGALKEERGDENQSADIYEMSHMADIQKWCADTGKSYWEYVQNCEDSDIWDYFEEVWKKMREAVERGLEHEGMLPGPLHLQRKAPIYYIKATGFSANLKTRGLVFAYSLAVSEENASGGEIVTAPTCGSCGVVPAVLYHLQKSRNFSDVRIYRALATAGLVGNIAKTNASISGAEAGCQAEVGVACAMAAAAANYLFGGSPAQTEYAAEMGLEHHLGMTCDPICGLVQIPCIERNAHAAARALDANIYATFTDGAHRISYDRVVEVMKQTGHDLPSLYRETSEGGLAKGFSAK
ncbi:MAG: L-serine ammonia-lyase, iron-sulfur-dependent, subunit alpha [Bacteroidaceae bacterium]